MKHIVINRFFDLDPTYGLRGIVGHLNVLDSVISDSEVLFSCYTLENSDFIIPGNESYFCKVNTSRKFHTKLPLLDVNSREGIRIHAGNFVKDSAGCILVGEFDDHTPVRNDSGIILSKSRTTLDNLLFVLGHKPCLVTITDPFKFTTLPNPFI